MSKIRLRFATLELTPEGAVSEFADGARWGALPHDKPHYHALAYRMGLEGDTLRYCQTHELAHHVVAEGFGSHSWVLWALAHGEKPAPAVAAAEEALSMALQRYCFAGETPFIDGFNWAAAKDRMLTLLREADNVKEISSRNRHCAKAA